ncbi:mechanosensitive ion channel [Candidatus Woesearchaeota archaeon]|nr:mechanosensitive ion channel [Candidatus Woesearchaeota archaeon]
MADLINQTTTYLDIIFSQIFTKIIVAIIILLIGFVIARIVGKLLQRFFHEIELNKILEKAGVKIKLETVLSNIATYFIYFVTIIWALNSMGLTTTILNMVSAAFLVLIIISIILAIKDFVPNLISGLLIHRKNIIKVNDKVKIDNVKGTVKKISLIETEVKTSSGDTIYVPNSTITKKAVLVKKK